MVMVASVRKKEKAPGMVIYLSTSRIITDKWIIATWQNEWAAIKLLSSLLVKLESSSLERQLLPTIVADEHDSVDGSGHRRSCGFRMDEASSYFCTIYNCI